MTLTLSVMVTLVRLLQSSNEPTPIIMVFPSISTLAKFGSPWNEKSPIPRRHCLDKILAQLIPNHKNQLKMIEKR